MTNNDPELYEGYSVDDEGQLQSQDTLDGDDVEDQLDRGYSPPEKYSAGQGYGNTPWEQSHDRPMADRLAEEDPEPDPTEEDERRASADDGLSHESDTLGSEVGDARAGRLVDTDGGLAEDTEKDLIARDVGIDGAAASAEEAAMHVIDEDEEQPE
ncbi:MULTISPECIES: DUF5709 domain-containing protein [Nocardioides]|uniref:DUF5709 domain-containing protein n=1 Tax=Nocardioides vastitatis TaxID=2568655 RepID=A0ABW0ZEH7_9ACTN|nr:DUF5709 domain-containing protein [Nocardioides sp.]THI97512.1 hypothetical protein E7Z54_14600 [Nocardioides sp.]